LARRYVLDSSALLALLQDEPGAQMVEDLIVDPDGDTEVFISSINLGEVLYVMQRHFGEEATGRVEDAILSSPKIQIADASWDRVRSAARIKAIGGLSYAGCLGAALADEMDAYLVTSDPEFGRWQSARGPSRVVWLG